MLALAASKVSKDNNRDLPVTFGELAINEISAIFEEYLWYIHEPRMSMSSAGSAWTELFSVGLSSYGNILSKMCIVYRSISRWGLERKDLGPTVE
jgi:hypothetical protein